VWRAPAPTALGSPATCRRAGSLSSRSTGPHSHTRAHRGKTDRIDAEAAARSLASKTGQAAAWRPDPTSLHQPVHAAKYALSSLARRITELTNEINEMENRIAALVERSAPHTLALLGLGPIHTAQTLVTAGQNIDRLRGETAFAHLCAADPIPASSGKTIRHRLNPYGDRDADRTLHMIAVVRLRYCQRTRACVTRRTAGGLSEKGHHALPQTLHRQGDLPRPTSRPQGTRPDHFDIYRNVLGRFMVMFYRVVGDTPGSLVGSVAGAVHEDLVAGVDQSVE
jgi:transposase